MKIEIDEIHIDNFVKQWLQDTVEMSQTGSWDYEDDIEFWEEMGQLASRMLKLNWRVS